VLHWLNLRGHADRVVDRLNVLLAAHRPGTPPRPDVPRSV
jgi:hypothetical protein